MGNAWRSEEVDDVAAIGERLVVATFRIIAPLSHDDGADALCPEKYLSKITMEEKASW